MSKYIDLSKDLQKYYSFKVVITEYGIEKKENLPISFIYYQNLAFFNRLETYSSSAGKVRMS
ncbi:MAG: hypothetical protein M0P61_05595 [Ignavibacteriaceae bacterium]|nr:hypothetical protein [Ignavibacteriaceae bacterium]